jgi:hypothetical protein
MKIKDLDKMANDECEAATKRYILMGDIIYSGRISVLARSLDEALERADAGEFTVFDEQSNNLAFDWNGDDDSVETEDL